MEKIWLSMFSVYIKLLVINMKDVTSESGGVLLVL